MKQRAELQPRTIEFAYAADLGYKIAHKYSGGKMARKILGFIAGLVVANIVIILSQMISGTIYGVPEKLDKNDPAAMAAFIS